MKTVIQLDAEGFFGGFTTADESPLEPGVFHLPAGAVDAGSPPELTGGERAQFVGNRWAIVQPEPEPEPEPEPSAAELLAQARAAMPTISPMQGILTLGETEWGKILTYRETATWQERIVIDNAADWFRTSENIAFFGHLLEYTDEQMDALFIAAAKVRA